MSSPIEPNPFKTPPASPARDPSTPVRKDDGKSPSGAAKDTRTPQKYHRVEVDKNGKIKIPFSPETANAKNVVYVFRKDGRRYYGLTKQSLQDRCSQHIQSAQKAKSVFHKALARSPQKFEVGVAAAADSPSKLGKIEKELIEERGSRVRQGGFNMRAGGGGLRASVKSLIPEHPPATE